MRSSPLSSFPSPLSNSVANQNAWPRSSKQGKVQSCTDKDALWRAFLMPCDKTRWVFSKCSAALHLFFLFFFFRCAFGDFDPLLTSSSVAAGDAFLLHARGFAWHANELCVLCIMTLASVVSLCVSVCVSRVCGSISTPLHIVYRKHPIPSSYCTVTSTWSTPQGYRFCCDISNLSVCWLVMISYVCPLFLLA